MEKMVEVNGEEYFVRDSENGEVTLLFLHGWPDDCSVWRYQAEYFEQRGYRVVTLDWPAHGKSSVPQKTRRCNSSALAADVMDLLKLLDIGKVHLIAHDYGASVAWVVAALHGARFESFIPLSVGDHRAVFKEIFSGKLFHYYWLLLHGMPFSRWYYLRNGAREFHRKFSHHPDAQYLLDKLQGSGDKTFFTIWERSNPALPLVFASLCGKLSREPKIQIPTFGIYSDNDAWMTNGQMKNSSEFVDSHWEYSSIPDCGHWLQLEKPYEVNRLIDQWLGKF